MRRAGADRIHASALSELVRSVRAHASENQRSDTWTVSAPRDEPSFGRPSHHRRSVVRTARDLEVSGLVPDHCTFERVGPFGFHESVCDFQVGDAVLGSEGGELLQERRPLVGGERDTGGVDDFVDLLVVVAYCFYDLRCVGECFSGVIGPEFLYEGPELCRVDAEDGELVRADGFAIHEEGEHATDGLQGVGRVRCHICERPARIFFEVLGEVGGELDGLCELLFGSLVRFFAEKPHRC